MVLGVFDTYLPGFRVRGTLSKFGGILYTCGVNRIWGSFRDNDVEVGEDETGECRKLSGDSWRDKVSTGIIFGSGRAEGCCIGGGGGGGG